MAKRQNTLQHIPHEHYALTPETLAPSVLHLSINAGDHAVLQIGNNNAITSGNAVGGFSDEVTALEAARLEIVRRVLALNLPGRNGNKGAAGFMLMTARFNALWQGRSQAAGESLFEEYKTGYAPGGGYPKVLPKRKKRL